MPSRTRAELQAENLVLLGELEAIRDRINVLFPEDPDDDAEDDDDDVEHDERDSDEG